MSESPLRIRNIATVYVFDGESLLLMHRVGSRLFQGSIWVGIGGHFEATEMNDPLQCALRELSEETGLTQTDIAPLRLRYITTRKANGEIRQQYIFFTQLTNQNATLTESDEGESHWIPCNEIFARKMAYSNMECLKHYFAVGQHTPELYLCALGVENAAPSVQFTALREYGTER